MSHHDKSETRDLSHLTKIDVVDVAAAVEADKLTDADVFKRTYLGHGSQSSVFVFQGHAGPVPVACPRDARRDRLRARGHGLGDGRRRDAAGQEG